MKLMVRWQEVLSGKWRVGELLEVIYRDVVWGCTIGIVLTDTGKFREIPLDMLEDAE